MHHKVIQSFYDNKLRYQRKLAERKKIMQYWKMTEILLANKSPCMEAEYAMDERTPLQLYTGMIPMLKEQRRYEFKN